MVVNFIKMKVTKALSFYRRRKMICTIAALFLIILFGFAKPQQFKDLWLTHDQQGRVLFELGKYQQAAHHFSDARWKAYSLYAAEQFDQAATLYNQFEQTTDLLARANALAHARRYVDARDVYQSILSGDPGHEDARHNISIIQNIIDEVNRMSESQQPEEGDSSRELGDAPQTGEGAEKQEGRQQVIEQLEAEQLLLDPGLNEMWLRQIQKNPALFLSNKFQMQIEQRRQMKAKAGEESE